MNFNNLIICLLIATSIACSKDENNNGESEKESAKTNITFAAGETINVMIGVQPDAVTGTITNENGLQSYSAYYTNNNGTRSAIEENVDLAGATSHNFSIQIPIPNNTQAGETGSILIKVTSTDNSAIENKTITINYVEYTNPDRDYFTYSKLPENLNFTETKAFPNAQGYGKYTTGGRSGEVYTVTTLEDDASKKGSLRYAIERSGARIIVFAISGTIELKSSLTIKNGNITIAGQTAPGDGICLTGNSLIVDADNVIIRYIRSRPASYSSTTGDVETDGLDAAWGRKRNNIIIDHCSFTWSTDEAASFYGNENFTMQYCIIGESLYTSTHTKGSHGYGGIWGGTPATFHHNLIISNDSRNPRFDGNRNGTGYTGKDRVDFINNIIFNWGGNNVYGGEGSDYNIVNNYYKPGPATKSNVSSRIMEIYDPNRAVADGATNPEEGRYYFAGNYMYENKAITDNNLLGVVDNRNYGVEKLITTEPIAEYSITPESAQQAYETILESVGASIKSDAVDIRLINFVKTGIATWGDSYGANTGIIDDAKSVGGLPKLESGQVTDTDLDGMPDKWEELNGLNNSDKSDAKTYTLNKYYTNLEMYINSISDF